MTIHKGERERRFSLWGWLLFLVCSIFFITSAVLSGDTLYLIGSVVFLFACLVFIIPLVVRWDEDNDN